MTKSLNLNQFLCWRYHTTLPVPVPLLSNSSWCKAAASPWPPQSLSRLPISVRPSFASSCRAPRPGNRRAPRAPRTSRCRCARAACWRWPSPPPRRPAVGLKFEMREYVQSVALARLVDCGDFKLRDACSKQNLLLPGPANGARVRIFSTSTL